MLDAVLHRPAIRTGLPLIVVCHSFMAFKDWGFFPVIAGRFARLGYTVLLFDFSRNGVARGGNRITDFGRFAENTFSRELEDLTSILDAVEKSPTGDAGIGGLPVLLLGHSRGGGIAIVQTSRDTRVRGLVTWSSIAAFDRWTDHQKRIWKERGYLPLAKETSASPLRLGEALLADLENHRQELDILTAAGRITVPWLIVHGKADVTVPYGEAVTLSNAARPSTTTLIGLDAVGHLYNAASAAEDGYRTLDSLVKITDVWLHHSFRTETA